MKKIRNNKGTINNKKLFAVTALCLLSVALVCFFAIAYPAHIAWQEQNQIFLNSADWATTYLGHPAWLGCLAGDWLTQFFCNVWIGAMILALAIGSCVAVFLATVRRLLPDWWALVLTALFALLMIGCSLASAMEISFFLCVAGGILLGLPQMRISPLSVALSYWAFGFGSLITAGIIVAFAMKRCIIGSRYKRDIPITAAAIFIAVGMPALGSRIYALPYSKALLYPGFATPSMPQMSGEKRMEVADAFYERDYASAKQLALKADTPDDLTAFYYYLASAVQDSLPDCLLKYPVKNLGTLTTIGESTPLMVINMMNDLYYELGDMTYAERAAMMRNVFSPRNRNVRMMQRLAEVNLVSGDTLAAMKYLRILDKTFAYRDWSRRHKPGKMAPDVEKEITRRRANSNSKDNLRLGDNCRNIILELLESNPHNTVALDYLLCTDLLLKDMDTFKMDYDTYCMEKGAPRYKDLYQQALMIYLAGTDAPQEEWERYIVEGPQSERFRRYSNQRGNPAFRDTYWYYFDKL